jgi:hypothetical protein
MVSNPSVDNVTVSFPFDRGADRIVCSNGERSKRFNVFGAEADEDGMTCDADGSERRLVCMGRNLDDEPGEEGDDVKEGEERAGGEVLSELTSVREDTRCKGFETAAVAAM